MHKQKLVYCKKKENEAKMENIIALQ